MSDDKSQLLIPSRIRVGFNKRPDTYTGLLGYVIYYDTTGKLRKEKSFDSWRDSTIEPIEYDNVPTEGFVINKDVGGKRRSWSHYGRAERVRVWDPRNHEFEISIENLLFILREGVCNPGKGLEGKFVYAWDKNPSSPPVLLPVTSLDYQNSQAFTGLQNKGVKLRQMVPGHTYITKKQKHWIYLGKFDFYYAIDHRYYCKADDDQGKTVKYVFAENEAGKWGIIYQNDVRQVAALSSAVIPENFAELVQMHTCSARGSRIAKLFTKPTDRTIRPMSDYGTFEWFLETEPGLFGSARTEYYEAKPKSTTVTPFFRVEDGVLHIEDSRGGSFCSYHPDYRAKRYEYWPSKTVEYKPQSTHPWIEPTTDRLFAILECGVEVQIDMWSLRKD